MNRLLAKIPALLLTLIVGLIASSSAFATATIVIQNTDAPNVGFNDTTAATPVGGNSGTTVGQQRLIAFQAAANIWGATLISGPIIVIRASWSSTMTCTATSGTLGTAGTASLRGNFANAPFPNFWYGIAQANALAGSDLNGATAEISAQFNSNVGTTGCLQNSHWYYGLDNNHGTSGIDLVAVLLHEFSHGLGFQSFTDEETGAQAGTAPGLPSIFDKFLLDNTTGKTWPQMTNAERVASVINNGNLVWNGPQVTSDDSGATPVLTSGKDSLGHPQMYAPNPVEGGSSVSHWSKLATPNQLMEPNISGSLTHSVTTPQDLTFSSLRDIGWCAGCPQPPPPSPTPTPSPPANDNFANAKLISGCSGSVTGTNVGATNEAGEPVHIPASPESTKSVWYQWQSPSTGSVTIDTIGSDFDTLLAVYRGSGFPLTFVASNDDILSGTDTASRVTFAATQGTVYRIAVDGFNNNGDGGDTGIIKLNWTENCSKTDQTITFGVLSNKTYLDPPFAVSASASSGLPVSFSILSGPATISGNTITITGAGTVAVRASQSGNANFNAAPNVDRSFTVAKANQTIAFNSLSNKTYGGAPFTVSATSTSNLPVSFSILSGPATISGNTITITGVGTVVVRASQSGNANFNAAPNVDRSFTVGKAVQTITFGVLPSKTYGDAPFTVSATSSSNLPVSFQIFSGPATMSGNTVTLTGTGTVTVRASQAGNSNYNAAPFVNQSFSVGPVVLLLEAGTNRAAALDSVTFLRGPFPIISFFNFSADHHTRVIIFTSNLGLSQPVPALSVQVRDASFNTYALTVENVGTVTGVTDLNASYIVVRLPDGLPTTGDLSLTVTLNNVTSNSALIRFSP